jgi:hypothetical protein
MSRNPHRTHWQVPSCRNWTVRGHTHCRPRRNSKDREDGA